MCSDQDIESPTEVKGRALTEEFNIEHSINHVLESCVYQEFPTEAELSD
jgi:hypothetical protein